MLDYLLNRRPSQQNEPPRVAGRLARTPAATRIYAVGDVHGRADLLMQMQEMILHDAQNAAPESALWLVYLGDYIDRGHDSRRVIEVLLRRPLPGFAEIHLIGNHEAWMLGFLDEPAHGFAWLKHGGEATLASYGIDAGPSDEPEDLQRWSEAFNTALPERHRQFLESLHLYHRLGDYFFVHAGIRPSVPLDQQQPEDFLWIREPFLSSQDEHGVVVVHGHTVTEHPVLRRNRVGIDTGACWSERLTCLVLEGETCRFLATNPAV